MTPIDNRMRQCAELTARVITKAEDCGLPDAPGQLASPAALRTLARTHGELCDQIAALCALVNPDDPSDPIRAALVKVRLLRDAELAVVAHTSAKSGAYTGKLSPTYGSVTFIQQQTASAQMVAAGLLAAPPGFVEVAPDLYCLDVEVARTARLTEIYRRVGGGRHLHLDKHTVFIVRQWDGIDGCWTDCTGDVSREEALRVWAKYTADGTCNVAYAEITYYGIFPGGTRMHYNSANELHR